MWLDSENRLRGSYEEREGKGVKGRRLPRTESGRQGRENQEKCGSGVRQCGNWELGTGKRADTEHSLAARQLLDSGHSSQLLRSHQEQLLWRVCAACGLVGVCAVGGTVVEGIRHGIETREAEATRGGPSGEAGSGGGATLLRGAVAEAAWRIP